MFQLQFKCRLCGAVTNVSDPFNARSQDVSDLLNRALHADINMSNLLKQMTPVGLHNCTDGGVGVAELIGAKYHK